MNEVLRERYRDSIARIYPAFARNLAEIPADTVVDAARLILTQPDLEDPALWLMLAACVRVARQTRELDDLGCMLIDLWALGVYQGQRGIARIGDDHGEGQGDREADE